MPSKKFDLKNVEEYFEQGKSLYYKDKYSEAINCFSSVKKTLESKLKKVKETAEKIEIIKNLIDTNYFLHLCYVYLNKREEAQKYMNEVNKLQEKLNFMQKSVIKAIL